MKTPIPQESSRSFSTLLLLALGLASQSAFAQPVAVPFYEEFPSSYMEGGNLGAVGVSSTNWALGTSATDITVGSAYALSFPGLQLPDASSKGVRVAHIGASTSHAQGGLFTSINSGRVYASFLFKLVTKTTGNRIVFELHSSSSASSSTQPAFAVICDTLNQLGLYKATNNPVLGTTAALTIGDTNLVVVRYTFNTGSATDDTVDLWLNPASGDFGNAIAPTATLVGLGSGSTDAPQLRTYWMGLLTSSSGEYYFDEFRLGTTWASVTPSASASTPDAANSTVTASPNAGVPADGATTSTITITARNSLGNPISGIAPGNVAVAATGGGNTIVQPGSATDVNGQTTATIASTTAETKTISVTISGVSITQQPTVQFVAVQSLIWNGDVSGNWNTSTPNWQGSLIYAQNDLVRFDDTASGSTTVNLTTSLTPTSLTVSNLTRNYTFNGSGDIAGAVGLTKDGAATLTMANTGINTFSEGVSILGGTLQISGSANRLPAGCTVALANVAGAQLDLNNLNQTLGAISGGGGSGGNVSLGSGNLTLAGDGGNHAGIISGTGMLIKTNPVADSEVVQVLSGPNNYSGGTIIAGTIGVTNQATLAVANQTGSGTGSGYVLVANTNAWLSIGNGGPGGSVAAATITNHGTVLFDRSDDFDLANFITGSGDIVKSNINRITIPIANTYTGAATIWYGTVRINNPGALGTTDGGTEVKRFLAALELTGGITLPEPLIVQGKNSIINPSASTPAVRNISGTNTLTGQMDLTPGGNWWIFDAAADRLNVSGPTTITNSGLSGTRTLWLTGAAVGEWGGNVVDGPSPTVVALRKDGSGTWILSGVNTYTGASVVSNGTLMVNGSIGGGSVTVQGGAVGGSGTINVPVTVNALGTLAPGASIGTLHINNDLALNGTTIMEVSPASNDQVAGINTLSMGGTLQVVVVGTLVGGEAFKLFAAASYMGNFAYDLPALPSPLGWDFSSVPVDGTLKVTGGPPKLDVSQAGSVLTFSWTEPGFKLQSQTNAINVGINNNWSDYPGGTTSGVTATLNPANPTVFFRLISQ